MREEAQKLISLTLKGTERSNNKQSGEFLVSIPASAGCSQINSRAVCPIQKKKKDRRPTGRRKDGNI